MHPGGNHFKDCANCGFVWNTREEFLTDPAVVLIGYQPQFTHLKAGLFLFNHTCHTTLALRVELFADLYGGPVFKECRKGLEECPGYCLHQNELRACPNECECTFVREIMQAIRERDTGSWAGDSGKKIEI